MDTKKKLQVMARRMLRKEFDKLTEREKRVLRAIMEGFSLSRSTNREFDSQLTLGQRVADKVAEFGGSWTFIFIFGGILIVWVVLNSIILVRSGNSFDPYPYILLNLFLSMLAAIQAPIIMMSQNRQAARDRLDAYNDYEVNLKAELEIRSLHEKIDSLRENSWEELVKMQQDQIKMLTELLEKKES